MKQIDYCNVPNGAFAQIKCFNKIIPNVLNYYFNYVSAYDIYTLYQEEYNIVLVPTYNYEFNSLLDLIDFIKDKTKEDRYYLILHRDKDIISTKIYYSTFGIVKYHEPFLMGLQFVENKIDCKPHWYQELIK